MVTERRYNPPGNYFHLRPEFLKVFFFTKNQYLETYN